MRIDRKFEREKVLESCSRFLLPRPSEGDGVRDCFCLFVLFLGGSVNSVSFHGAKPRENLYEAPQPALRPAVKPARVLWRTQILANEKQVHDMQLSYARTW